MAEARTRRIESEIQRVLYELVAREVKDPRVGNITITAVSLAADMGVARVFFTPFASRHPAEEVQAGLTRAGGSLRDGVVRRLRLRHAPAVAAQKSSRTGQSNLDLLGGVTRSEG